MPITEKLRLVAQVVPKLVWLGLPALATIVAAAGDASAAVRDRGRSAINKPEPVAVPQGPLTIVVSLRDQKLALYSGTEQIAQSKVSSGTRGHETPTGIFSVIQKERMHYSNLYNSAPMPFMQRITWSGVALHAGYLPGYAASHGCVRLPPEFARRLYEMTKLGARVVVTGGDVAPSAIAHDRLASLGSAIQVSAAGMAPPMHLGAPDSSGDAGKAEVRADEKQDRAKPLSLLKRAQTELAERTLALEGAKAARSAAAQRLEDALAMQQHARDASNVARAEVAKSKAKLQRAEAELASREKAAAGGSTEASGSERPADPAVTAAREQLEVARRELEDREETAREIAEESDAAERGRAEASLASEDAAFRLKLAEEAVKEARRDVQKRDQPITMFVSRKTGKLHVRQGFEPILETALPLQQPDQPVGTHVFTAHAGASSSEPIRWTAMTVPGYGPPSDRSERADARRGAGPKPAAVQVVAVPVAVTATAALDRLQWPAEVVEQIADLIKPGSSLIISDQGLSPETGKYTDVIVQTR